MDGYKVEQDEDVIHRKLHEWGIDPEPAGVFPGEVFEIPTGTLVEEDEFALIECERFSQGRGIYREGKQKAKMGKCSPDRS